MGIPVPPGKWNEKKVFPQDTTYDIIDVGFRMLISPVTVVVVVELDAI